MALQLRRGTNAERLLITPQQGELIFVTDYLAVNITATTIASNLITFSSNHSLIVGQKLLYVGVTANGLTQNTVYYVLADGLTNTACKLSTTLNGTVVTLTNATGLTALFNKSPTNASGTPVGNVSPLWVGNGTTVGGVAAQTSVLDDLLDVTITSVAEGQTLYYDANTAQWKNTSILKVDDTSGSTNIEVTGTGSSLITINDSQTVAPTAPLILRHTSTGTVGQGFGTTIGFEAEAIDGTTKTIGYLDYQSTDSNNNYQFGIGLMKDGVAPSPTLLRPLTVDSNGHTQITGNLTVNRELEGGIDSYIKFGNPNKNGILAWNSAGTGLFINGNFDVDNGANSTVNITAGSDGTIATSIANIFNTGNIGTINIGNGVTTELNLGNAATGTRTQIKSPNVDLLGDIKIGGNDIKSSTGATAITLSGSDVVIAGDITVTGNDIKSSTGATAITLSGSDVTTVGDLTVGGNDIKNSVGTTQMTLATGGVIFAGDIQVNGNDIKSSTGSTAITLDNNSIVVAGDATVEGGNINLNGTTPFLTFATQADGANTMYGIRGKSTIDDAWFIGSGSTGDDLGYLEIATGDNAGGTNTGGQIYVRQYNNGATAPFGVPWEGGNGVVVNELTLLDNLGNTQVPKLLTVGGGISVTNGSITTPSSTARLFSDGGQPTTIDFGASASALSMGHISGTGTTTVRNSLTVSGDLTVNGTTTTVNSTTVTVDDKNIELGSVVGANDTTASGGGITLKGATDKTIIWNNSTNGWELNQPIKVTGKASISSNIDGGGYLTLNGSYLTLRNASTGTPTIGDDAFLYVKRGDTGNPAYLGWYENNSTWYFNNNLQVASNLTANTGLIGGVYFGKDALGNSDITQLSVAKGSDLSIQSGSTLLLNTDYIRFQRNTSRATSIITNIIGGFNGSAHNFNIGDRIQYTGSTGNGLTQNSYYYVSDVSFSTSTCRLATTLGGTPITLTAGTNLNLTFFSEGGLGNAYFNLSGGQYAFNRETPSGNYNLEVEGTFNATGNSQFDANLVVNGNTTLGNNNTSDTVTMNSILTVNGGTALTPSINTAGSISVGEDIYSYGDTGIFLNGSSIVFNNNTSGSPVNNADLTVARGSSASVKLRWNESTGVDRWQFTNDGTLYTNLPVATDKPTYAGLNVTSSIDSTSGALQLGTLSNNPIKLTPNGTGNVFLEATTVQIGESTGAQLTTGGSDLRLDTNNSNNSGYITITAGVDGNITLAPNGNGQVVINSLLDVNGNITADLLQIDNININGNTISSTNTNGAITISPNGTGATSITSDLTVSGNLTVNGTTTTVNSTTLTVDDKNIELGSVTTPTDTTAAGGGITLKGLTDKTITWNNSTDGWELNQPVKVTGAGVFSGNVAVNGGDITTTDTSANLFTTNATSIAIGSSATTVNYSGLVTHSNVITDLAATTTLTQTTAHNLTSTTRRGMKLLINITDNVTKDVHIVEVLLVTKVVSGVGTVYMTTFGEVTSAGQLATFSADSNGTTTYFYVTPLSTNSTTFAYSRRSI